MRRSWMYMLPALTLALTVGAAGAQQTGSPQPPHPGRGAMRNAMRGTPAQRLLGLRSQLGLSTDQVARLEALGTSERGALKANPADRLRARADLLEATQKGDLTAARAAMDRIAKMRTDRAFNRLKAGKDAESVLTADQKARLQEFRGAAIGRMRAHRGRGMRRGGWARRGMARQPMMRMRPDSAHMRMRPDSARMRMRPDSGQ